MSNLNLKEAYEWDVAISLCKEDVDFANKLVRAINPSIKVFFYQHKQEELINKSGPEEFAKVFKEKSRLVIILSRKEWSDSYYTEIERNAIIDRTSVKNQGYNFLFVIPMVQGEIPSWYPSTRIYANPFNFSTDDIAKFIEFKLNELGAIIVPITVEHLYNNYLEKIKEKSRIINLQKSKAATECANNEIKIIKDYFNLKSAMISEKIIDNSSSMNFHENRDKAYFEIGNYRLYSEISLSTNRHGTIDSTQNVNIFFEIQEVKLGKPQVIESERRVFYYEESLFGWSLQTYYNPLTSRETQVLFFDYNNRKHYDLTRPISTNVLVDIWFQKLIVSWGEAIDKHL